MSSDTAVMTGGVQMVESSWGSIAGCSTGQAKQEIKVWGLFAVNEDAHKMT